MSIVEATRRHDDVFLGASPRGSLALFNASRAWAAIRGRAFVTPDDVKSLAIPVFGHRILLTPDAQFNGVRAEQVLGQILSEIAPPADKGQRVDA